MTGLATSANTLLLAQEHVPTKGITAVFAVVLMFLVLAGGVWLLLQSSFGPKQAYLISSTAFWGCWLLLAVLWFTGVPKLWPGGTVSTPRFNGPQGGQEHWTVLNTAALKAKFRLPEDRLVEIDPANLTDQNLSADVTAAETAAAEEMARFYAAQTGAAADKIVVGQTVRIVRRTIVREDGRTKFARIYTAAANPTASTTEEQRPIIAKIQPAFFDLHFDPGSLGKPTQYSLALFFVLFLVHALGLARYEANRLPPRKAVGAAGTREREPAAV